MTDDWQTELTKAAQGEDNDFVESTQERVTQLLEPGLHVYGGGFTYLLLAGVVFVIGWRLFSTFKRI